MQTEELFFNCTLSAFITGPALLHHSHWLAASLGPVSQHVLLVWTHLRSTGWSADQKEGKRGGRKLMERTWTGDHEREQEVFCGLWWTKGNESYMYVSECARVGHKRGTDRKTTKIKVSGKTFGCQATGLLATVVLSYEEWYDFTSPIWFQDGVGVGLKGEIRGRRHRNVSTCPDLSGVVNNNAGQHRLQGLIL